MINGAPTVQLSPVKQRLLYRTSLAQTLNVINVRNIETYDQSLCRLFLLTRIFEMLFGNSGALTHVLHYENAHRHRCGNRIRFSCC